LPSNQVRSFIALDLEDPQILSEVDSVLSSLLSLGADLKPVGRENIHVTIKFLGNVETGRLGQVKAALDKVDFSKFVLEVKGAGAFPSLGRMNVIWVGLGEGWSQVQPIYEQVEKSLSELGFPREARGFSPHVTIARVRSGKKRDETGHLIRRLSDKIFGAFTVDKVRLKQSILSSSGPKYSTLHEVSARDK
jgi:2'-5' RNA ligase